MFRNRVLPAALALVIACVSALAAKGPAAPGSARPHGPSPSNLEARLRRPVALAATPDRKLLFVANQQSGSVSTIDCAQLKSVAEVDVGRRLADLAIVGDGKRLLAVDPDANELIVLSRTGIRLNPERRIQVPRAPISVQITPDGRRCSVASLWARKLTIISLGQEPKIACTIDLPFAPNKQLAVSNSTMVVADAFGGHLAVIDVDKGVLESVRDIPVHNIRGLALSSDRRHLWLTDQMLNSQGHAQVDDIRWGNLITNNVHLLSLDSVLKPKANLLSGSDLIHLGDLDHGTGDPAGIVERNGGLAVALAGVGEIALGLQAGNKWEYVSVGGRPTAMISSPDGSRLYAANPSLDSISVIDPAQAKLLSQVKLGPRPQLTAAQRGEDLFHDASLSHQGWLSCQSCHPDGHTNGKLADTLGDDTYGTPKRILSLRGVGETGPWAWNGSITQLDKQVEKSITSTMQGRKPTPQQVQDLTAFLKTLPPAPAAHLAIADESAAARGKVLFASYNCARCHTPPLYTSSGVYNVGLHDEVRHNTFNPPSLRGVSQGGPYFHDGRAATLKDVFSKYRHQLKDELNRQELADLLAFLATL